MLEGEEEKKKCYFTCRAGHNLVRRSAAATDSVQWVSPLSLRDNRRK